MAERVCRPFLKPYKKGGEGADALPAIHMLTAKTTWESQEPRTAPSNPATAQVAVRNGAPTGISYSDISAARDRIINTAVPSPNHRVKVMSEPDLGARFQGISLQRHLELIEQLSDWLVRQNVNITYCNNITTILLFPCSDMPKA